MKSLDQYVQEQVERDPAFAHELEQAEAELRLARGLAALREARGWTQRQLAERLGVPQPVVARYEKAGRTPSIGALWRMAQTLDVAFVLGPNLEIRVEPASDRGPRHASPAKLEWQEIGRSSTVARSEAGKNKAPAKTAKPNVIA